MPSTVKQRPKLVGLEKLMSTPDAIEVIEEVITELDLAESQDCGVIWAKDPSIVAFIMCRGFEPTRARIVKRFVTGGGKARPKRVIFFGFEHGETKQIRSMAIHARLSIRNSIEYPNINFGQYTQFLSAVKSAIFSMYGS